MRRRLAFIVSILLLLAACSQAAEEPAPAGKMRLLLYRAQPPALLLMNEGLSAIERQVPLSLPPGCSLAGLYPSPRGEALLAELTCQNGPAAVLLAPADGKLEFLIADRSVDSHFLSWSGDGEGVYLRVGSMTEPRILYADTASRKAFIVTFHPHTYDMAPAPDGKGMLSSFSGGLGLGSELWISTGSDGRNARQLLAEAGHIIGYARPSPSGDQIVYIKIPDSQVVYSPGELWLVDATSGKGRKLAQADAGHGYAAAWSPDGRRVAFVVRSNPQDARADSSLEALVSNIAVVELSSGKVMQITHYEQGRAGTPLWSPDGNTLIFAYVLDGRMNVQIADPAGTTAPSTIMQEACCPAWMRK
jgi:Tol biopolymer transport system component